MRKFEIGNEEFDLPESWAELSVERFEKLLHHSSIFGKYKSHVLHAIETFGILLDCPSELIKKLDRKSYNILAENCEWSNDEIVSTKRKSWVLDGQEYMVFDNMDSLLMEDNISLELIIKDSVDTNLTSNILPVLIRKVREEIKDGKIVKVLEEFDAENYEYTKELFKKELMIGDVLWIRDFFLTGEKESSTTTNHTLVKGK